MKVLLINGSPKKDGTTFAALSEVEKELNAAGVETELYWVGKDPIRGCTACGGCTLKSRCAFKDGDVNGVIDKIAAADGLVVGSPVHYAAASGAITSLLDRVFFAGDPAAFADKPGAAIAVCRRGGATAALEQLNKYFTISNMPLVGSQYWNMVHGHDGEQARQDYEGMQTMRSLGKNMAWLLKCIEAGQKAGVPKPDREPGIATNFIR